MALVDEKRTELAKRVDLEYREGCRNFFKEEVDPWGVRSADLKAVEATAHGRIKTLSRQERYQLFEAMWRSDKLEEGAIVCHVGRKVKREFGKAEFGIFEGWIDEHVHNWAHCDGVSSWLLAACIENEPALRSKLISDTVKESLEATGISGEFLPEAKRGRSFDFICEACIRLGKIRT